MTGEPVDVPPKKIPHFKPGKELKERVLQHSPPFNTLKSVSKRKFERS